MPGKENQTDPLKLQFFFIRRKDKVHNVSMIKDIISELVSTQGQSAVKTDEINEVISKYIKKVNRNELCKPRNDLARLTLVIPEKIYDRRTLSIREKSIFGLRKAKIWYLTQNAYELARSEIDSASKIIARSYLSNPLLYDWITQLSAYGEKINASLAIKVLESIILSYLKYTTDEDATKSLQRLLMDCKEKPRKLLKRTLKPLEIVTDRELISINMRTEVIKIGKIKEYVTMERKITLSAYLNEIAKAYYKYLVEYNILDFILEQKSDIAWPVPLAKILNRIEDVNIRTLSFEKHINLCEKLSQLHEGFVYAYQPFAKGEDKHILRIRLSLLRKILSSTR